MRDSSLFQRLRRLFSTNVVIRSVDGNLKVTDTERIQSFSDLNTNFARGNQFAYLHSTANRIGYDTPMNFSAQRMMIFNDYELMEMDPLISAALDIFSDNSTIKNDIGEILSIHSDNSDVKNTLHNLFYDILNIEFNAWPWIRQMVKYGDMFLKIEIAEKFGVVNVIPISAYEIVREEGFDPQNPLAVRYSYASGGNTGIHMGGSMEKKYFDNYEIAHFRMLSDTNWLPYGKSAIESARRIWKQLQLMEDAMLIHRIMRAPEKRIFKMDVANIPPNDVEQYLKSMVNKIKKVPYVDPRTGEYNLKYNIMNMTEDFFIPVRGGDSGTNIDTLNGLEYNAIDDIEYLRNKMLSALKIPKAFLGYDETLSGKCLHPDTKVSLLNGEEKSIKEISELFEKDVDTKLYTYSYDTETNSIIPTKIKIAKKTRLNADVVKVTLDNGEYVISTPDHGFVLTGGEKIQAKDLKTGDSLQAVYRRMKKLAYNANTYEQIYQPNTQKWEWTHKVVDSSINGKIENNGKQNGKFNRDELIVVHHKDFNRKNNEPLNLVRMTLKEHIKLHSENMQHGLLTELSIKKSIDTKRLPKNRKHQSDIQKNRIKNNPRLAYVLRDSWLSKTTEERSEICKKGWDDARLQVTIDTNKKYKKAEKMMVAYKEKFKNGRQDMIGELNKRWRVRPLLSDIINHINLFENKNEYNKFSKLCKSLSYHPGIIREVIETSGYTVTQFMNWQFGFIKGRNSEMPNIVNHKVVSVEILNEKVDTYNLEVENKNHNFLLSSGIIVKNSTLAAEDVRFSFTINRVQEIFVSELYKIAIVHLYSQGFDDDEITNFSLSLTSSSTILEHEKISLLQEKVSLVRDMKELKMVGTKWMYKNIFNMSEEEIEENKKDTLNDIKTVFRHAQIESEGNDPLKTNQTFGTPHDIAMMQKGKTDSASKQVDFGGANNFERNWSETDGKELHPKKDPLTNYGQDNSTRGRDALGGDGYASAHKIQKPETRISTISNEQLNTIKSQLDSRFKKGKSIIKDSLTESVEIVNDNEDENNFLNENNLLDI